MCNQSSMRSKTSRIIVSRTRPYREISTRILDKEGSQCGDLQTTQVVFVRWRISLPSRNVSKFGQRLSSGQTWRKRQKLTLMIFPQLPGLQLIKHLPMLSRKIQIRKMRALNELKSPLKSLPKSYTTIIKPQVKVANCRDHLLLRNKLIIEIVHIKRMADGILKKTDSCLQRFRKKYLLMTLLSLVY